MLRLPVLSLSLLVGDGVAVMLVVACDGDVEGDAVLEEVGDEDFCSHSMGDHEALATAVNVSVGGESTLQP